MRVGDSRSFGGPGFLPLQHHKTKHGSDWPIDFRCSLIALRILGRLDNEGGKVPLSEQGQWIEDGDARGDVMGGMHWHKSSRPIGGWRFSWPVKTYSDEYRGEGPRLMGDPKGFGFEFSQGGKKVNVGVGAPSRLHSGAFANLDLGNLFGLDFEGGKVGISIRKPTKKSNKPGTETGSPQVTETGGDGSGHCKTLDDPSMLPIWRGDWSEDIRFVMKSYERPKSLGKYVWPKFPMDWYGIVLQADHEDSQEELFYPTDPRLVAVHCHGDEEMGSFVTDMGGGFRIDTEKIATLQSAFKVGSPSKDLSGTISPFLPKHGDPRWKSFIALNVGVTGCDDNFGGLLWQKGAGNSEPKVQGPTQYTMVAIPFADSPNLTDSRNMASIPNWAVPEFNRRLDSGAFGRAGFGQYHKPWAAFQQYIRDNNSTVSIAADPEETVVTAPVKEGCPIGRYAHVSQKYSGPFEFDCGNDHVIGEDLDGNKAYAAHLSLNSYFVKPGGAFDGPLKHDGPLTGAPKAPFPVDVAFGFDGGLPHPFIKGSRYGMQRWKSWTYYYEPFNPPTITPRPRDITKKVPEIDIPLKTIITSEGREVISGDAVPAGDYRADVWGSQDIDPELNEKITEAFGAIDGLFPDGPLKDKPGVYPSDVREYNPDDGMYSFIASTLESAVPAFLARPQKIQGGYTNFRNWTQPDLTRVRAEIDSGSPITGRMEAYGAQGPKTGSTYLASSFDWDYTNEPGKYRYNGGTASGGWCLMPAEVDLANLDNNLLPTATGTSVSTTSFVAGRGAQFGTGLPDLENGGLALGYTMRDSSGDLVFGTNASSVTTDQVVFDSTGNVGIGQTNPTYKLQVKDSGASPVDADILQLESAGDTAGDSWGLTFCNSGGLKSAIRGAQAATGATFGEIVFATAASGSLIPYTVMYDDGAWRFHNAFMDPVFVIDPESQFVGSTGGLLDIGVNTQDTAGGSGVVAIANAYQPPLGTPTGGGVLYTDAGSLMYKGSSGTVTEIAVA